ncbi:hypothetical protein LSTR_LSTR008019 [Laodelphax striatellus]|uniref:Centrosomal protein of 135 kDa n=1 Tax=Laodelphax striatellus TaxID=195883 RepID=A0A482WKA8_LAOST|nr:hypothetical protein LSTR_LSTR008019 [Laodelphax striatellus]
MGLTEQRCKTLRSKLDELGYRQPLALESLLLVEQIFSDLIHTKEERDHYKNLFHQNQERYGDARTGIEPLKQENEKLVRECKRLRQALSEEQDVNEKLFKDLKHRIRALESNNSDLEFVCSQHLERINELSHQLAEKGQKILLLKGLGKPASYNKLSVPKTHPKKPASAPGANARRWSPIKTTAQLSDLSSEPILTDVCTASKKKVDSLLKELVTLKQEKLGYLEEIAAVQSKVAARNQEIERLQHMLELAHNTPMPNAGKCLLNCCKERCCCGGGNAGKVSCMETQLREQLTECQELQHEAMCRASLAGLKSASTSFIYVFLFQEKLDCKLLEIEELESKLLEQQKANKELETEKGASEAVSNEQRKLEERVRELNIIERDLMSEIERLTEVNRRQHDRIQHLENRLTETEKRLAETEAANTGKRRNSILKSPHESMPLELTNNSQTRISFDENRSSENRGSNLHETSKPNNGKSRLKSVDSMPHELASNSQARTSLRGKSSKNVENSTENRRSSMPETSKSNAANQKSPVKKMTKNIPIGGSKTQNVANRVSNSNGKDKTVVKENSKPDYPIHSCVDVVDSEDDLDNGLRGMKNRPVEKEMMSKQMKAQSSKVTDKNGAKQALNQKSPVRQPPANHNANFARSKTVDAKKTLEREPFQPPKTAAKPVQGRAKSKDETDASSSSESNRNNNDAGPPSKSDRFSTSKSKKSTTSSAESERRLKEKAQEEEKLRREKQLLVDERKRLEDTIRNLTEKQTELINKLHEAYARSAKLNDQGVASSVQPDKEQIIKLERLQAERDTYQKELSKIRDQIANLVDSNTAAEPGSLNQSPSCILQRLVTERDFYQKEFNRLQKQLSTVNGANHDQLDVGELRAKLNEKEQEIMCLKEKIREMCAQQIVTPEQLRAQNGAILRLEMERDSAKADCSRLEEDRNALKDKLRRIAELNKDEMQRLEQGSHALQTTVTRLEVERRELLNNLAAANQKVKMLEKKLDEYREQMQHQQTDLSQQISHLNHIKLLQEQTDRALSSSQDMLTQTEAELASALERIHELEQQRLCVERELCALRTERMSLKSNMSLIDEEKDKLLLKVDEKTEQVVRLERDSKSKESRITNLESVLADMQRKLDCALDSASQSEQNARQCSKELDRLKQEMVILENAKDAALKENTRLQDDLAVITNDHVTKARELEVCKREVEDLKMQLQGYVTEVRHIEDILEQKEKERSDMLDHFKSLSQEANALESSNHTLESEAKSSKSLLRAAQQEVTDLRNQIEDKDALVSGYEKQISELTAHIACLEMKLANESEQIQMLERELTATREHCSKLHCQKEELVRQVSDQEASKKKVETEYHRVQAKHEDLEEQLDRERKNSATLENVLAATRQETLEKKLSNKELRQQVEILEEKVAELQRKLNHGNDALRQCQADTADYHQQLADLRREVTNERFERARADERAEATEKDLNDTRDKLEAANNDRDCLMKCVDKLNEKIAEAEGLSASPLKEYNNCEELSQQLQCCQEKLEALAANEQNAERLKTIICETEEQVNDLKNQLEKEKRKSLISLEKNCEMEEKLMSSFQQLEDKNASLQKELDCVKSRLNALESDNVDLNSKLNLSNCLNEEYESQIDKLQQELNAFRLRRASSLLEQKAIEKKLSSAQQLTDQLEKKKDSFLEQIMEIDNRKNYHDIDPTPVELETRSYKPKKKLQDICAELEAGKLCSQNSGKESETGSDGSSKTNQCWDNEGDRNSAEKKPATDNVSDNVTIMFFDNVSDRQDCQERVEANYATNDEMENMLKNEEEIIRGYEEQIEKLKQRLKCMELEKNSSAYKSNCHCPCSNKLERGLKSPASKPSTVSQIENVISNLHMQLKAKDELLKNYTDEIAELAIEELAVEERENNASSAKSKCKCSCRSTGADDSTLENYEQFVLNFTCEPADASRSDPCSQMTNRRMEKMPSPKYDGRSVKSCGCLNHDDSDEDT